MRLACAVAAFIMAVGGSSSLAATGDPAVDALIDKLVEKKVITREDARELEDELKKEKTGEPKGAVMEPAKEAQTETAKEPSKLKLPFELKVRAQTRLDTGDLLVGPDDKYRTETDLFLRRVRLEVDKEFKNPPVGKELDLNLTMDADRFDQDFRNGQRRDPRNRVDLHYLYGDWIFLDEFGAEVGKHKLPFLRAELTSSARQLLI